MLRLRRYDRKSAISLKRGYFDPKFQVEGVAPTNHLAQIVRTLSLAVFTQKNCVAFFVQAKCDFTPKRPFCVFEPSALGATYGDHLKLLGKRVLDVLLMLIELFFAKCYGWGATSKYRFKIGNFAAAGAGWYKILGRSGRSPPTILHVTKLGRILTENRRFRSNGVSLTQNLR